MGRVVFSVLALLFASLAQAATYHVVPGGRDAGTGSASKPFGSLATALAALEAGDTLVLGNGTYRQPLHVSASGRPDAPVTIRAQNDGRAVIDGDGKRMPCRVQGSKTDRVHDVVVEGVRCQNSNSYVFQVQLADRIALRRVSAYDASVDGNFHVFNVVRATDVLLEDTIAGGAGRNMYHAYLSRFVTHRRCFARWTRHGNRGAPGVMQVYGTSDSIVENCIGTRSPGPRVLNLEGIAIWANKGQDASRNRILGNVIYDLDSGGNTGTDYAAASKHSRVEGTRFIDNVSIRNDRGLLWWGHTDLQVDRLTVVGARRDGIRYEEQLDTCFPKDPRYESHVEIRNSLFIGMPNALTVVRPVKVGGKCPGPRTTANPYLRPTLRLNNNFHRVQRPHPGLLDDSTDTRLDPGFQTEKYGRGAYLFSPPGSPLHKAGVDGGRIGAEVLYRYQDGVLTDVPLWPWPMEDRIQAELGVSVTWQSSGGLWKSLDDVYPPAAGTD